MPFPQSTNIKLGLVIGALLIVASILFYTQTLVNTLLDREREIADLYAKSLKYMTSSPSEQTDYSFVFDEVIKAIDFPIILTDKNNEPQIPYSLNTKNIFLDSTQTTEQQAKYLKVLIEDFDISNPPIKIAINDTIILQYLHYGESDIIKKLRWLPLVEIALAGIFILLGYIGFSYIKRTEQSNIWVGMAKETAHQLGTPLSSVLGWIELIKMQSESNPKLLETTKEMENDLRRLQRVTERFSKIGSKPALKDEPIKDILNTVVKYFIRRLPQFGKNIDIQIESPQIVVPLNRELFEWVIENLIKNALDAINNPEGKIEFHIKETRRKIERIRKRNRTCKSVYRCHEKTK